MMMDSLTPAIVLRNLVEWLLVIGVVLVPVALLVIWRWRRSPSTRWAHPVTIGLVVLAVAVPIRHVLFTIAGCATYDGSSCGDFTGTWVPPVAPFILAGVAALAAHWLRRSLADH